MERDFEVMRRRAAVHGILAFLANRPVFLVPFERIRQQLGLARSSYIGLREVEIEKIIGSVNRYEEFDNRFFPRMNASRDRWQHIRSVWDAGIDLPPVRLYKVGEAYFVEDGNHRISVASSRGARSIEAEVTEFSTHVEVDPRDVPEIILVAEREAFLRKTRLDVLRPGHAIRPTRLGAYETLLGHIEGHRYFRGLEGASLSFAEAVASWYDRVYNPLVGIFRSARVLDGIPGHTEADLYVWISGRVFALEKRYGSKIDMNRAVRELIRRYRWPRASLRLLRGGRRPSPERTPKQEHTGLPDKKEDREHDVP